MPQADQSVVEFLGTLQRELSAPTPGNDYPHQAGQSLEKMISGLSAAPEIKGLLYLIAEGLRAVSQTGVAESGKLLVTIVETLTLAEQYLLSGHATADKEPISRAAQKLRQVIKGEPTEEMADETPQAETPPPPASNESATAAATSATQSNAAPEAIDLGELEDVVREFLVESYENLDQLDRDLIVLEQDPNSRETLASIFRTIHTIKGTCGWFGFAKLESVTHVGESLLSRLRDGKLNLNPEITSALLALVDAVREILGHIETARHEGSTDYTRLIETLTRLQEGSSSSPAAAPASAPVAADPPPAPVPAEQAVATTTTMGEILVSSGRVSPDDVQEAVQQQASGDPRHIGEILVARGRMESQDVVEALQKQGEQRTPGLSENNVRVDVGLLDRLMNLVGELVLARNQILQYTTTRTDATFGATAQRLNHITTELQESVMKTRMQPIGNIWSRFPRVVRDLALACGKQIRIEMEGKETELDKTIIEAIKDPLTHIVRNSADHGIEKPDVRLAAGKPAEGHLLLRAFHESGQVNIEISDDGAGIDGEKVRQKALQRGLISAEQAARMSEREILHLIFMPGFSTAAKVTNISGRGVGMDVVKTNIEKIGGTVDIQSRAGQGTTIRIKIPLTLAIIPALIVTSGGDRYAIPQVSLLELVRLENEQAHTAIETIYDAQMYRLRGNLLPLVWLNRELGMDTASPADQSEEQAVNIVVLRTDDRQFGLVVDEINDTEEIVVKPLSKQLKGVTSFAGATIMGDGKVALILDVVGIGQAARLAGQAQNRGHAENIVKATDSDQDRQLMLIFKIGQDGRMAIPLSTVARLEEFPASMVERSGQHEVIQYRGRIMPLLYLSRVLDYGAAEPAEKDRLHVVVYSEQGRSIGLVVDQILDIVEESLTIQQTSTRPGVLGSAVIQQRVTDLLDIRSLVTATGADCLAQPNSISARA